MQSRRPVDGHGAGQSPEELAAAILRVYPAFQIRSIRFDANGNANEFHIQHSQPGLKAELHVSIHPETGKILQTVDRRTGFWHWLRELHHNLLAGRTGRLVNGAGAALLLLLCLSGIVLWWPGPRLWTRRLRVQPGTGWKRLNWDLHHAAGFWMAAVLSFFAFSGLVFAFPQTMKGAIRWLTASPAPVPKDRFRLAGPTHAGVAPLASLLAEARRALPGGRITQVKYPTKAHEPLEIRMKTAFDGHQDGNNRVLLHPATARLLHVERFVHLSRGNQLLAVLEPLHTGRIASRGWFSLALRSLWLLAGLAPGLLFLTGFLMWWNRVLSKRLASLRPSSPKLPARAAALPLLLLSATLLPAGTGSIAGRVLDGSGAAVAGARVTLAASPERVTRSDAEGRFEFSPVAPGIYLVQVEAAGFEPLPLQVRAGASADFVLSPARVNETVVVNAGTFDQIRLDETVFQTGLTRSDIATRNNRRLSDVVARMPGVFMTGPPGGDKDIRLRGLDKEFSRTQVDGIALPDGGEKRELQLNRLPSSIVESVRIIRNPTAEFESDGLAGRVDVQTRSIPDQFRLEGRAGYGGRANSLANGLAQGQLSAGGRWGRYFGFSGTLDYLNDTLPIGREKLLATRDVEAESERQHQRSPNFFGDVGLYTPRWGEFHFKPVLMAFDTTVNKLKETYSAAGLRTKREEEAEEKAQRTYGLSLNHRFAHVSGLILDTQAGWFQGTEDKDKSKLAYKVAGTGAYTPDKRTLEPEAKTDRTWQASSAAALPFRAGLWHELKFGGSFRTRGRLRDKDRFEAAPNGVFKYTGEAKDRYRLSEDYYAGFVQDRLRFSDRLSLTPGVRYERVRLRAASAAEPAAPRYFTDVNPSAHLLYRASSRVSLRAAASRGLSRPKFDELAPYENVSSTKIVIGNPDLLPARAWSYDTGVDYATPLATVSVNAFRKTVRGVIEEIDTGIDRDGRDVYRVGNVGNGWVRGLELEQRLRFPARMPRWARLFSWWANQTLLASNLRAANGQQRPFKEQPRWMANFGADFSDEATGTSFSVMANFLARRFDYKVNGDVSAQAGSSSIDVAFYQRLRGNWRLFLEGNNLANRVRVQDEMFLNGSLSRRTETFGRSVLAGIQVNF